MAALPGFARAGLQSGTIMTFADIFTQTAIEGKSITGSTTSNNGQSSTTSSTTSNKGDSSSSSSSKQYDPVRTARWTAAV